MNSFSRSVKALLLVASTSVVLACAAGGGTSAPAAGWTIDSAQSSLNFVTTKAGQAGVGGIGEVQTFKRFAGGLDPAGQLKLAIDLASVDTGVEIRDERLRTMLWNVKATPQAVFTARLSPEDMRRLASDAVSDLDIAGQLELAGQARPVTATLRAMRMSGGRLMVATRAPIVINSNDFGLKPGVEAMRDVMGLNFLASTAPVNFAFVMNAGK